MKTHGSGSELVRCILKGSWDKAIRIVGPKEQEIETNEIPEEVERKRSMVRCHSAPAGIRKRNRRKEKKKVMQRNRHNTEPKLTRRLVKLILKKRWERAMSLIENPRCNLDGLVKGSELGNSFESNNRIAPLFATCLAYEPETDGASGLEVISKLIEFGCDVNVEGRIKLATGEVCHNAIGLASLLSGAELKFQELLLVHGLDVNCEDAQKQFYQLCRGANWMPKQSLIVIRKYLDRGMDLDAFKFPWDIEDDVQKIERVESILAEYKNSSLYKIDCLTSAERKAMKIEVETMQVCHIPTK